MVCRRSRAQSCGHWRGLRLRIRTAKRLLCLPCRVGCYVQHHLSCASARRMCTVSGRMAGRRGEEKATFISTHGGAGCVELPWGVSILTEQVRSDLGTSVRNPFSCAVGAEADFGGFILHSQSYLAECNFPNYLCRIFQFFRKGRYVPDGP